MSKCFKEGTFEPKKKNTEVGESSGIDLLRKLVELSGLFDKRPCFVNGRSFQRCLWRCVERNATNGAKENRPTNCAFP